MDNFQFWLYVIIAVIYLISRSRKKAKEQEGDFSERPSQPSSQPKQMSFEDLLREITEAKQPQPKTEIPKPFQDFVDYDDEIEEVEEKSLEKPLVVDDDRSNKIYEEAKKLAFQRPSLEETMKLENVNTTFGRFKEFDKKKDTGILTEYAKALRDPKGFRRALILSEIINRRHF